MPHTPGNQGNLLIFLTIENLRKTQEDSGKFQDLKTPEKNFLDLE